MVVWDLAVDVMENMRLRDTMSNGSTDPTHEASKISKEVAVQGRKRAAREGELTRAVVGKKRVSMLEECDEDKPVVDPITMHGSAAKQDE